jgi:hypothetical protein
MRDFIRYNIFTPYPSTTTTSEEKERERERVFSFHPEGVGKGGLNKRSINY